MPSVEPRPRNLSCLPSQSHYINSALGRHGILLGIKVLYDFIPGDVNQDQRPAGTAIDLFVAQLALKLTSRK